MRGRASVGWFYRALAVRLLVEQGVVFMTKRLKSMRAQLLQATDWLFLRKCVLIESVNDHL